MRARLAFLLTTATVGAMVGPASAELVSDFAPFLHDTDAPGVLRLDGVIDARTPLAFKRALQRFQNTRVLELVSGGGSVYAALPLAYDVRAAGLRASIPAGAACASACSYLFFAGVGRDAEGRLGVHAIAMPGNDLAAGQKVLGDVFALFEDFGVPAAVHTRMMAASAEEMYWFDRAEMMKLGLIAQIEAGVSDDNLLAGLTSQLELETRLPAWSGPPAGVTPGQIATVEAQRAALAAAPDDIEAREVLASYEAALGNYAVARQYQQHVITMRGAEARLEDYTMLAYYLVAAAGGVVSREAETVVRAALARDQASGIALYYLGLMYAQNGRADTGYAIWRDLLERSGPGDAWFQPVQDQIGQVGALAGVGGGLTPPELVAPPVSPVPEAPAPAPLSAPVPAPGTSPVEAPSITPPSLMPPTGRPAPTMPQTGNPSAGERAASYPPSDGLAVMSWGFYVQNFSGTLSGPVTGSGSARPYSMRIFAADEYLKVEYPELGCGGYWELIDNSSDPALFAEVLTYGSGNCHDGATISLGLNGAVSISAPAGGGASASATLR